MFTEYKRKKFAGFVDLCDYCNNRYNFTQVNRSCESNLKKHYNLTEYDLGSGEFVVSG